MEKKSVLDIFFEEESNERKRPLDNVYTGHGIRRQIIPGSPEMSEVLYLPTKPSPSKRKKVSWEQFPRILNPSGKVLGENGHSRKENNRYEASSLFPGSDRSLNDLEGSVKKRPSPKEYHRSAVVDLANLLDIARYQRLKERSNREALGEVVGGFVKPSESSRNANSSLKKKEHSGKESHGYDVLSLFASSGRSLFHREGCVQKANSLKENHGETPTVWKQGRLLGAGGFGKVYECLPIGSSVNSAGRRAVKVVKMEPQYTEMAEEAEAIKNEINILENLKHKRIVSFHGSEQRGGFLYLFMEHMPGGSLSQHIKAHKVLFESESRRYTKQILEGLSFLHAKNIIHRDIKGSNVLLDGEGNVKLADFGLSKTIQKIGSKTDLISHCGTPYWTAPEIMHGKGYGRKADIWSVGCTVVEMLTGRPPLYHLEPMAAIFQIGSNPTEPSLPATVSQNANHFVQAALTWNPSERPWSEELLKHNFILDSSDW